MKLIDRISRVVLVGAIVAAGMFWSSQFFYTMIDARESEDWNNRVSNWDRMVDEFESSAK